MKRRLIYGMVVVVLGVNLLIGARVYLSSAHGAEKDSAYPSLELFSYVMEKVRKDYVDGQKLTYQELVYGALKGMLNTLDPHSEFMEPEKYKELQNDTQGAFGGLGIVISMKDSFVTVVAPMEDSPGFKAGILSGDRILKIDGKSTERMSLPDAVMPMFWSLVADRDERESREIEHDLGLEPGALEMSNVSVVKGMVDIVSATRGFEACERAIDAFREADRRAASGIMGGG